MSGKHIAHRLRRALVWNMNNVDTRHLPEQFHCEMIGDAIACRPFYAGIVTQNRCRVTAVRDCLHAYRTSQNLQSFALLISMSLPYEQPEWINISVLSKGNTR